LSKLSGSDCTIADWPLGKRVRTLLTTRAGGVSLGTRGTLNLGRSVGDDTAHVAQNRRIVADAVASDGGGSPRWMSQVHGVDVADMDALPPDAPITADAAIARGAGNVCTVMTADCLPLLFCDRDETVVGAAHAGWRGLNAGVIEATVLAMNVVPEKLFVFLGPAIGPTAFEVGDEVRDAFLHTSATMPSNSPIDGQFQGVARSALFDGAFPRATERAFLPSPTGEPGKWLADIYALARIRLHALGVPNAQIFGGNFCTYTDEARFFSHRRATHRGEPTGRMASLIWLASD
jgi:polyphenol oxidase